MNSQVFDHTSVIQLVETWLAGKGKSVRETNISPWRRTVCGDLTSVFRPYGGEKLNFPTPLERNATVESIHAAKFKSPPKGGHPLSKAEVAALEVGTLQEPGTRPSCPLPYDLVVNAAHKGDRLEVTMEARDQRFGKRSLGAPFNAYRYGEPFVARAYAVRAGESIRDEFEARGGYHIRVDGPNGFMREFRAQNVDPGLTVAVSPKGDGLEVRVANENAEAKTVEIHDEAYGVMPRKTRVAPGGHAALRVETHPGQGWYDFTVRIGDLAYRYAGRAETGRWGITDPAMGGKTKVKPA